MLDPRPLDEEVGLPLPLPVLDLLPLDEEAGLPLPLLEGEGLLTLDSLANLMAL